MVLTAIKVKPEGFNTAKGLETYVGIKMTPDWTAKLEYSPVNLKKKAFSEPTLANGNRNWNKILSRAAHSQSQKQAVDLPLQILTWTEASESASSCPPDGDSELWPPAEPH